MPTVYMINMIKYDMYPFQLSLFEWMFEAVAHNFEENKTKPGKYIFLITFFVYKLSYRPVK